MFYFHPYSRNIFILTITRQVVETATEWWNGIENCKEAIRFQMQSSYIFYWTYIQSCQCSASQFLVNHLNFYNHSIFIESWVVKAGNHHFWGCDVHPHLPSQAAAAVAFLTSKDAWHLLERHAQRWLTSEAPHPRCPGGSLLRSGWWDFRRVTWYKHEKIMKTAFFFFERPTGQHSSYLIVILIATPLQRHQYSDDIHSFNFNQNFLTLKHHLQRFLRERVEFPLNHNVAVFLRALEAVLRLGSLLTRRGIADVDAIVRRRAAPGLVLSFDILFGSPNISTHLNTNSTAILFFCYLYSIVRLVVCFFVASI